MRPSQCVLADVVAICKQLRSPGPDHVQFLLATKFGSLSQCHKKGDKVECHVARVSVYEFSVFFGYFHSVEGLLC